jgi:selenide,water dikinase
MTAVKDMEKRRRVMRRSMRLGHCICDPKQPCPCEVFRKRDLCPCAGEHEPVAEGPVRLTEMVARPGCASKIDEASLRRALKDLPMISDPNVLLGAAAGDDAGIYRLNETNALVQTVDVFAPSVDDPYLFGQIAAANSLSDVYAMGGRPICALSIVGFPIHGQSEEVLRQILLGGIEKMNEAGVPVVGGHSINEEEIKAGFAVSGLVDPQKIIGHDTARAGDLLVLTKSLGTGILAFASQIDRAPKGTMEVMHASMARLNRHAAEEMVSAGAHAATDITGFGLLGHVAAMAEASEVSIELILDDLPLLPGVLQCAVDGILPGGIERNREASASRLQVDPACPPELVEICFDAQTSGGLLVAIAREKVESFLKHLRETDCPEATVIGSVRDCGTPQVILRTTNQRELPPAREFSPDELQEKAEDVSEATSPESVSSCCEPEPCCSDREESRPPAASCCGGSQDEAPEQKKQTSLSSSPENHSATASRFFEFMQSAGGPGSLDARCKKAISIALSVALKCEPCLKSHLRKAREMGMSEEEIEEAAWMGISFGGAPAMMFYKTARRD